MKNKAALYTLGCKLNFAETSVIGNKFIEKGYGLVNFSEAADVYVINTCTVTENAERECRQIVRRALKNNPNASVIVTGCYAQLRPEEIAAIDGVDLVLGSNEKFEILDYLKNKNQNELSCINVTPTNELNQFNIAYSTEADSRTRAFLKVQDGCDYSCTYCTIPLARGGSRSSELNLAVDNFKKLLDEGYKEIVLTGVNVGDYGKNADKDLYDLLLEFVKLEGDFRLRISSIEPNLLTGDILKLAAATDKISNHFHIPLQSGNNKILKLMQRRYNTEYYEELIYKTVETVNDVGIGVDVIVGFPGETEGDFLVTYDFIKKLPISYLHVFTYSERPDTKAVNMDGQVSFADRKKRNRMLRILSEKKHFEFAQMMTGKNLKALFETNTKDEFIYGFTSNYLRVKYPYDSALVNKFKNVNIKNATGKVCTAELIKLELV